MVVNKMGSTEDDNQSLILNLLSESSIVMKRSWEFLYKTHYPAIKDYIRSQNGTNEEAIDIFQDSLMILHKCLINGKFRQESLIKTYLFSICKNLWLKELKRKKKEYISTQLMVYEADLVSEEEYLINVEVVSLLLNELGKECQDILIEFYFNNRSLMELKDRFNVNSIQAAKNKKKRCLQYLERLYRERGTGIKSN